MTNTDRPNIDRDFVRESRKALQLELENILGLIHVCSDLMEHGDNLDPGHARTCLARLEAVRSERNDRELNASLASEHATLAYDLGRIERELDRAGVPDIGTWCKPAGSGEDSCEADGRCVNCGGSGKRDPGDDREQTDNLVERVRWLTNSRHELGNHITNMGKELAQLRKMYDGAAVNLNNARLEHENKMADAAAIELKLRETIDRLNDSLSAESRASAVEIEKLQADLADSGHDMRSLRLVISERDAALHDLRLGPNELDAGSVETIHQAVSRVLEERATLALRLGNSEAVLNQRYKELLSCQDALHGAQDDHDIADKAFAELNEQHKRMCDQNSRLAKLHADALDRVAKLEAACADQAIQIGKLRSAPGESDASRLEKEAEHATLAAKWSAVQPLLNAIRDYEGPLPPRW